MLTQLIAIIAFLWAGMIIGISFLESWVKFRAPTLTKSIGLDVGRTVFSYFHKVQHGLAVLILLLIISVNASNASYCVLAGILSLLFIQSIFLLPILNERVSIILAGKTPAPSRVHAYFGMAEITKLALLIAFGVMMYR